MSGAQFWRVTAPRGTLILRRWPTEHPTPKRLQFIHAVLSHAQRHGIRFLPLPLVTRGGKSFVEHEGRLWELAPWFPGTSDYESSPSVGKLQAALQALAQFHLAVRNFADPPATGRDASSNAITRRLARLNELAHGGTNRLARSISDSPLPELARLARRFQAALPRAIPGAMAQLEALASIPLPLQVCLRDIWHDHVLFTDDRVTGIVDFGAVDIDTPATDIARLIGSLIVPPPPCREGLGAGHFDPQTWRLGLAAYSTVRSLSNDELRAVRALDTSGTILAGCNWIRWIYIEGREFENYAAITKRFGRIVARLGP